MKKAYILLLILLSGATQAQIVNIPDPNFKARLLAANGTNGLAYGGGVYLDIDANNDGEIQVTEALAVDSLDVYNSSINDLQGILSFSNLKKLECSYNNMTSLDVSSLSGLKSLYCTNNQLTSLNVSGLANLKRLYCDQNSIASLDLDAAAILYELHCGNNQLTALDVTNSTVLGILFCENNLLSGLNVVPLTVLQNLNCKGNQLTELDLTGKSMLEVLVCSDNPELAQLDVSDSPLMFLLQCNNLQLTTLDLTGLSILNQLECEGSNLTSLILTGCSNLYYINCRNNALTSLDLTGLEMLQTMDCSQNLITSLDFSGNPQFVYLICIGGELTYLNLKNGYSAVVQVSDWSGNPLEFVCGDSAEVEQIQNVLTSSGLSNANVNTYCSFVPGGDYNTVSGTVRLDANNNGCDASDPVLPFVKIDVADALGNGAAYSNENGVYHFYTTEQTCSLHPNMEISQYFQLFLPVAVNFPVGGNATVNQDFCLVADGVHPDLEVVIAPVLPARPGFDAIYKIVYKNKGNQLNSGTVTFNFDDDTLSLLSSTPAPDVQSTGSLTFNYTNLLPFESRAIELTLHVNGPTDTPAVNVDDNLAFNASISLDGIDDTPADNNFGFSQKVVGSFDPNNLICLEGNVVSTEMIGEYLHYIANFENTGTYPAENVVVKLDIDEIQYDITTLRVLNSSHGVDISVNGNKVECIFKDINLGIGGHGNILLKIKTRDNLVEGDEVFNMANIYFDYNFPIVTNEARTSFQTLSVTDPNYDASISIYPNPAHDIINIKASTDITTVQLFDIQGRLLQTAIVNDSITSIDISSKQSGIYFVKITSENGMKTEKIIKQ